MKKLVTLFTVLLVVLAFQAAFAQGDYDAQRKAYEQQMILYRAGQSYSQASGLYKAKNFEAAIDNFQEVTTKLDSLENLNPKAKQMYAQTLLLMSDSYNKTEQYEKAAETFQSVRDYDPDNIDALYGAMIAYTKIDSIDKAVDVGHQIIEMDSTYSKVYPALGNIYKEQEKYDKAEVFYKKGVEFEPEKIQNMFPLANVYETQKQYGNAADVYQKILEKEPENDKAIFYYGIALEELGELDQAMLQFKKIPATSAYKSNADEHIKFINEKKKQ